MWGKGYPHSLLVGLQTGPATMEIWKILKKLKTDLLDEQPQQVDKFLLRYWLLHTDCYFVHNGWETKTS